jgi:hypothetical protein
MSQTIYPAGGLLRPGAHLEFRQDDQGKDLVTNWRGPIQAPGDWQCVGVLHDRPFPNGFGPSYPVIRIKTGRFANSTPWYIGHTTAAVRPGQTGHFGDILSYADQGHDWAGTHGGWVEFGQAPDGVPIHTIASWHSFDGILAKPLIVGQPDLRFGDSGLRVLGMSSRLRDCGYLPRPYWRFNQPVHGAVVKFKEHHHIQMPPIASVSRNQKDRGVVDQHTDDILKVASAWCKKHHKEI